MARTKQISRHVRTPSSNLSESGMPLALVPRKDISNCPDDSNGSAENHPTNNRDRSRSPIDRATISTTTIEPVPDSDGDDTIIEEPIPSTSKAPNGEYDIRGIIGSGYIDSRKRPEDYRLVVDFTPALMHPRSVRWDGAIPEGLPENFKDLVDCENPEHLKPSVYDYRCRWCGQSSTSRTNQYKHERRCRIQGAPGHKCVNCPQNCPGAAEWFCIPDAHKGNLSGKKGRPKKQ